MAEGFLGRWSRRKVEVREGREPEDPAPALPVAAPLAAPALGPGPQPPALQADPPGAAKAPEQSPDAPAPTLQDVHALTPESDFTPFAQRSVAPEVRNAAMKKLFSDPHFNVMDGLDIYIDDYTQPDPLPAAMLQEMASAQFMGLVKTPEATPVGGSGAQTVVPEPAVGASTQSPEPPNGPDVAQSGVCNAIPSEPAAAAPDVPGVARPASHETHDHADLRLQQDHAPGRQRVGHGTE